MILTSFLLSLYVNQDIRNETSYHEYSSRDARKKENRDFNRYRDVTPYDHSRVKLERGHDDYINASLISVEEAGRKYILTQGPLAQTTGHFWLMIWEQKSIGVLMLNGLIERGMIKCHRYWPLEIDEEMHLFDVDLKVKLISEEEKEHFIIRKCLLTDEESGQSRQVIQFHYTSWPDFGLPESPASFLEYLFAVRDSGCLELGDEVGPPVVHCSAGIGRSGTLCLVDSCLLLIAKHKSSAKVNVKDILLEMRRYRMGLIQTPEQLRFSYQAIIEGNKTLALEDGDKEEKTDTVIRQRACQENGSKNETGNNLTLPEVREKERMERKRKTQETIDRIKMKKKHLEDRSRFQTKLIRFGFVGLVVILGAGFLYHCYYSSSSDNFPSNLTSPSLTPLSS